MLIQRDVFPDLFTAKYKTLANEKLCLNNLFKKLVDIVMGKINRTLSHVCLDSAFRIGKEKADEYFASN